MTENPEELKREVQDAIDFGGGQGDEEALRGKRCHKW